MTPAVGSLGSRPSRPLWWERASARERWMLATAAVVVSVAVLYVLAWQPLTRSIERLRDEVPRQRAQLLEARAQVAQPVQIKTPAVARLDVRAAVERVLDDQGLRSRVDVLELRDDRVHAVFGAIDFATLVGTLDTLATQHGVRLVEGALTARVEPGSVRADVVLSR